MLRPELVRRGFAGLNYNRLVFFCQLLNLSYIYPNGAIQLLGGLAMPVKGWIEVDEIFCKGCELCVNECPQHVMALDNERLTPKGYHPVMLIKDGCTGW